MIRSDARRGVVDRLAILESKDDDPVLSDLRVSRRILFAGVFGPVDLDRHAFSLEKQVDEQEASDHGALPLVRHAPGV